MPLLAGVIDTQPIPRATDLVISVTTPSILSNPYSGNGFLLASASGIPAYGLIWAGFMGPSGAGKSVRAGLIWEQEFLNLQLRYKFADGTEHPGTNLLTRFDHGIMWFEHGLVEELQYDLLDGYQVNFAWLVTP